MKFEKKLLGFAILSISIGGYSAGSVADIDTLRDAYSDCYYNGLTSAACDKTDAFLLVNAVVNATDESELASATEALDQAKEGVLTEAYSNYYLNVEKSNIEDDVQNSLEVEIEAAGLVVAEKTADRDELSNARDLAQSDVENASTGEELLLARNTLADSIRDLSQGERDLNEALAAEIVLSTSLENSINSQSAYDEAAQSSLDLLEELASSPAAIAQEDMAVALNNFESADLFAAELENALADELDDIVGLEESVVIAAQELADAEDAKDAAEAARDEARLGGDIDDILAKTSDYSSALLLFADKNLALNEAESDLEILENQSAITAQNAADARTTSDTLLQDYALADSAYVEAERFALSGSPAVAVMDEFIKSNTPEADIESALVNAIDDNFTSTTAETGRAMAAEGVNATAISAETDRAMAAEGVNATAISAETDRAMAAEDTNRNMINSNTQSMQQLEMQLNENVDILKSGIASALAIAGMPIAGGEGMGFSAGLGYFEGESAVSVGLTYVSEGRTFKLGVGHSGASTSASAGMAFNF